MPNDLRIERLFDGRPLLSPQGEGWESGVTFNTAAVHLTLTEENLPAIRALLPEGETPREIVALHYRARPVRDPGFRHTRSYVGLSVHEPDLTPIRRFERPVLMPGLESEPDVLGAEDPRIARVDDAWWMVYCGVSPLEEKGWVGNVCAARSDDLVHWTKVGIVGGLAGDGPQPISNKDGVLFSERIEDKVVMLHRPMAGPISEWTTSVAVADSPYGPFLDLGRVHGAWRAPDAEASWNGAGAVPIKIGEGRYVSVEHTGNYLEGKRRRYVLDAFLYDFNDWDPSRPETLVKARIDELMRPETDFEVNGPFHDSVGNVVFACGAYVHDGWLYLVYGGGDSYILAARMRFDALVNELETRAGRLVACAA